LPAPGNCIRRAEESTFSFEASPEPKFAIEPAAAGIGDTGDPNEAGTTMAVT